MGADLYIKEMPREGQILGFEVSDRAVNAGYFRDAYNSWGLSSLLTENGKAFSWWRFADRKELFRKDEEDGHVMTKEGVKVWVNEVKPLLQQFLRKRKIYKSDFGSDKKKLITDKETIIAIRNHAGLLLKFMELALKTKAEIIWSV